MPTDIATVCRTYRCARRWRRLPRRRRCERTLALALARGVDWRDGHAHTALHHAAKAGDVHAVRRLIELGATVGAADRRGITPLHVASCQRHVDVVRLLVAAGADPNLKHYSGLDCAFDRPLVLCKSSLEMAAERGFDDVVSALKKERICSSEDQLSRDAIFRLLYSPRSSSSGCVSCPFDAPPLYWRRLSTVKFSVPLD